MMVLSILVPGAGVAASADDSVVNSKHDLSTFGPGPVRAVNESEICIFCHSPHNTAPQTPLWNRHNPTTHYRVYKSSTLDARMDQPGSSSKMCLSCHDGSIALGLVMSRSATDPIIMNQPFMPSGKTNLTNDLSNDHPIGFRFDRALANRDRQIRPPELVSEKIQLGPRGELECTACHDPHNNELGNFLRITERRGALCTTCHSMAGWPTSAHALSSVTVPASITNGEQLHFTSMSDNSCQTCHAPHNAGHPARLLRERANEMCMACHDGMTATDVDSVINSRSGHRMRRFRDVHDPTEDVRFMRPHVDCTDCHNPHAARANSVGNLPRIADLATAALVPPELEQVKGVSVSGVAVERARFTYEVCFRCHGDQPIPEPQRIVRQHDEMGNVRRKFMPSAASSHPITPVSFNHAESPSLLPERRNRQVLSCQDCHNNPNARELGGSGPNGPHGSSFEHLLAKRYETRDFTSESAQNYSLCYQCHDRNSILANQSFSLHQLHIVNVRAPCSACHDPHGVQGNHAEHAHLINFDTAIVGGRRFYLSTGRLSGSCTLVCHGADHRNFTYGPGQP